MTEARPTPRTSTSVPVIDARALLARALGPVIDLRSPAEYEEDHVPGAHNVPLFDDAERALVGLLYHRDSPDEAFVRGRELVLEKIEALVCTIGRHAGQDVAGPDVQRHAQQLTGAGLAPMESSLTSEPWDGGGRPVVLHCWRGGLRSRSVVALLRRMGLEAVALEGGYKSYRAHVRHSLEAWSAPQAFVLRGLTGVGKTLVLRELERIRPRWTMDLELAAGHRSSLLGMVGLEPCSQKAFESRLAARIRDGFPGPVVFEGESRKVGDAIVPPRAWEALRGGTSILLEADAEHRITVLIDDYLAHPSNRAPLRTQLALVEERMSPRAPLVELLDAGRDRELVRVLLEHYYDPLYRHSERKYEYAVTIDATDPVRAASDVADWIHRP